LKVLHTISSLSRGSGGPSRSVTSICNQLGNAGVSVNLLAVGHIQECVDWVLPNPANANLVLSQGWSVPGLKVRFCPGFIREIEKLHAENDFNLIHDHGLWLPNNHASSKAAMKLNIPFVLSTRGMLEPWALKYRGWKKKVVWWAWQKAAVESAAFLHATAKEEANNLRSLGFKNPIAIIPNGVSLPEYCATHTEKKERIALFLSRIHPVKGIMNLIDAWERSKFKGWKLLIVGPDENGHKYEVQRKVSAAGLNHQIEFVGSVDGDAKWKLFEKSSLFVLPSFSENFGIVIAEALAAGVPVITTKGTPWGDLIQHNCGWWIDIGIEPLESALREAMSLSDSERLAMGQLGRELVEKNYSWPKIAGDMSNTYRWILEGGTPPSCIRFD
jgi:glycosyltransferase involved in cell wall biosynthesis